MKRTQTRIMKKVCTSVALSHDKTNMQHCPFDLSNSQCDISQCDISQCDIERGYNSDSDSGEVDDSSTGDYYTLN